MTTELPPTDHEPMVEPAATTSGSWRRRTPAVAAAMVLSAAAIWGAAVLFVRKAPADAAKPAGVTITAKDAIALAPGAAQWQMLRLGKALPMTEHWSDPVPARVRFDATRASRVGSPLGGRVTRVLVQLGQTVKKGQALFVVASPDIAALRSERAKTAVDLQAAKISLERVQALVRARALPAKEESEAQQRYAQARLSRSLALSKLASLKVRGGGDGEFTAIAPRAGVVVRKNVLTGQEVSTDASKTLIQVADLKSLWVMADLPEADAMDIKQGAKARISSPARPSLHVDGVVELVSAVVDPRRYTVPIRVRVANDSGLLKANMFAEVSFALPRQPGMVQVPASAIVSDGAQQYVYVREEQGDKAFRRRSVVAGSSRRGMVPVSKGLKAGETIVTRGAILLDNQLALLQ